MKDATARCRKCRYQGRLPSGSEHVICDYLGATGRARSLICPPGEGCTVFERGVYQKKTAKGMSVVAETMAVKTDKECVEELVREGKGNRVIAELTGLPVKTVANYRYRMKKPTTDPPATAAEGPPPSNPPTDAKDRPWLSNLRLILDMAGQETDETVRKTIKTFAADYAAAQIEREITP